MHYRWVYGVITVPQRRETHLRRTLASLDAAGFSFPWLFVDGSVTDGEYKGLGMGLTQRTPPVQVAANWILSMSELYLRDTTADYYALFQDDILACKNLRLYLQNGCTYPDRGYWNLYTVPRNEDIVPTDFFRGWYESDQSGKGALGLVFHKNALLALLSAPHLFAGQQDQNFGHRSIDGRIITAMQQRGYKEYVHMPSLLQHTGDESTVRPGDIHPRRKPTSWMGEAFDCLSLMRNVS